MAICAFEAPDRTRNGSVSVYIYDQDYALAPVCREMDIMPLIAKIWSIFVISTNTTPNKMLMLMN